MLVVNLSWLVCHAHKSYQELILYLANSDLELYSHSFQFCFSHYNFIIWPMLMIILFWSCIMMNKLNMMIIIFWEHDNFIIWPTLMIILFWLCIIMNRLNMTIVILGEHIILSYDQHWWWDHYNWVFRIDKLVMMTIILKYVCNWFDQHWVNLHTFHLRFIWD
jgi:hypothetical protein